MPAVHMKNTHTCLFTSRCTHLCSGLTCAHGDGLYELVPPAVGPHQQSQVGLLYQLVHCVLPEDREITRIRRESPACSLSVKIPKWFIFTRICHLTFRRPEKSGAFVADCFTAFTGTILSEQTQMFSEFLAGEDGERSDRLMEQSVTTVLSMGPWWTGNKGVYSERNVTLLLSLPPSSTTYNITATASCCLWPGISYLSLHLY